MDEKNLKSMIGNVFNDIADALETGNFGKKTKVAVTLLGSEHGIENIVRGATIAQNRDSSIEVVLIGPKVDTDLRVYEANSEKEQYDVMEQLLDSGEISGCVTLHYSFPVGVSTVGKVVTPALGKEMFIATTTGTSSPFRVEAMILNGIHGMIAAKASGIEKPTIGILNVDGARQVERALNKLQENGYEINFAESNRADGGHIMRGNDLLQGVPDVMITDTLTGNLLMKMFSSFTTGGSFESTGYGYGPGIGEGYRRNILIISRASGAPVIANALMYAAQVAKGNMVDISHKEFENAKNAKLNEILESTKDNKPKDKEEIVTAPEKEVVTSQISGIDILELEEAVNALWKNRIYAESGMGCTGPIVMVNDSKIDLAKEILCKEGYLG